jgi:hypothetical protein
MKTYDPTPRPMKFTRDTMTIGEVRLVDVTVEADLVSHDTVPTGTKLTITGRWANDDTPLTPWLREAVVAAGHDQTATTEIRGSACHLDIGGIVLHSVTFNFGTVLVPDGVLLHGTEATFSGTTTNPVTFRGWNDPPRQVQAPTPRRVFRRIVRDESGQIVGTVEEAE